MTGEPLDHDELLKRIGSRIRQRRKEIRLTQAELGHPAYTKSYVSQIEQGQTMPSLPAMVFFAQRLGRPIDWFVSDEPQPDRSTLHAIAMDAGIDPDQVLLVLAAVMRRL